MVERFILKKDNCNYFGIKLNSIKNLYALYSNFNLYTDNEKLRHLVTESNIKHIHLINSLINSQHKEITYDLRYIVKPDKENYLNGKIDIVLLCRANDIDIKNAYDYQQLLFIILDSTFNEYSFSIIPKEELDYYIKPFDIKYIVNFYRRSIWEQLDYIIKIKDLNTISISNKKKESIEKDTEKQTFYIFPFIRSKMLLGNFFNFLLKVGHPLAVSFRMQPTFLSADEEEFYKEQISKCEKFSQIHLQHVSSDTTKIQPTLHQLSRLFLDFTTRSLFGLKDNAALLSIEVAFPHVPEYLIIDNIGNFITEPAGNFMNKDISEYFSGGYIFECLNDEKIINNFIELKIDEEKFNAYHDKRLNRLISLFDTIGAADIFHFPIIIEENVSGITVQGWIEKVPNIKLFNNGCLIGVNVFKEKTYPIRISNDERKKHIYVIGQTGTGKTTLLKTMILDDIFRNKGLCVLDPHGDLFYELLNSIPKARLKDVVVIDPNDTENPFGLNLLEYENEEQRNYVIEEFIWIIKKLLYDEYGSESTSYVGPIFFEHFRMNLLLVTSNPDNPGTLIEFYNIFQVKDYYKRWIPLQSNDPMLSNWVTNVLPKVDYQGYSSNGLSLGVYITSKIHKFIFHPLLRNIFIQKKSTINFYDLMNNKKIILVNLSKGLLTEEVSSFLGMVILAKILVSALKRQKLNPKEREDFYLYVDEFQSFATDNFITMLSEARKFGLCLTLANQFISQIKNQKIIHSIFGNVGTLISFRIGIEDAKIIEQKFFPTLNYYNLCNLPNWHAYIKTLSKGQVVHPFNICTIEKYSYENAELASVSEVINASRYKYTRPKKEVEGIIMSSI